MFHETSNPETKESILRIINSNELPVNAFASTWHFSGNEAVVSTWCCDDAPIDRPKL